MRIAVIAPPWIPVPPPAYGGTETVLDALCRGLQEAGNDVLLVGSGDSTCPVERAWVHEEAVGTDCAAPAAEIAHAIGAYRKVAAWRAEIVHDHTLVGPFLSRRFRDLPVVTTNHGPFAGDLLAIYRAIAPSVPVIAISRSQARTAGDVPIAGVIHHGVDLDRFPPGAGGGGFALFLGRMAPDKGVDAAARIAHAAGVPLKIAAKMREPAEREYFRDVVKPLLGGGVEYIGEIGTPEKHLLLGEATCLLNPIAWDEPFGMVMIEALACGTPVVTTPLGSASEIVDDGVIGFVRADEDDLAAAVLDTSTLDRAACRAACEDRFSMQRMANDHAELYGSLLEGRTAGVTSIHETRRVASHAAQ
jgi:glycosyltransferase involved in cell wall biosynthesis